MGQPGWEGWGQGQSQEQGSTKDEVEAGVGVKIRDRDGGQGQGQESADSGAGLSGQQWWSSTEAVEQRVEIGISRSSTHSLVGKEGSHL